MNFLPLHTPLSKKKCIPTGILLKAPATTPMPTKRMERTAPAGMDGLILPSTAVAMSNLHPHQALPLLRRRNHLANATMHGHTIQMPVFTLPILVSQKKVGQMATSICTPVVLVDAPNVLPDHHSARKHHKMSKSHHWMPASASAPQKTTNCQAVFKVR